jgi:hypothetical protein
MANQDNTILLTIDKFSAGYSPLAFVDPLTELGQAGQATVMQNVNILNGKITQGFKLSNLTGTLTEALQYIMDKAVVNNVSYAIGTASLYSLSATAITNIHTIGNCTEGESLQILKGNLLYFYNTLTAGGIGKYDLTTLAFEDTWGGSIQNAPHPSDKKEDIVCFGNGRYLGVYIAETNSMTVDKLDFGQDMEVADVVYNAGLWYIAVNAGVTGNNRSEGQIYLYDGAALINTLTDEAGVGMQRIGFLYRINGIVYVAYQDLSSPGFIIGYINGKSISPLRRFTGTLPTFQKKTLYNNTILFLSDNLVYSAGAIIPELPYQLSQIASSTYINATAIAAPFGTPLIASNNGSTYVISKFDGYTKTASWKSIVFPLVSGLNKAFIDSVTVVTKSLGANASCSLTLECDQATVTSTAQTITGTGIIRHYFTTLGIAGIQDFRVCLNWSGGSETNDCEIRRIVVRGNFIEG